MNGFAFQTLKTFMDSTLFKLLTIQHEICLNVKSLLKSHLTFTYKQQCTSPCRQCTSPWQQCTHCTSPWQQLRPPWQQCTPLWHLDTFRGQQRICMLDNVHFHDNKVFTLQGMLNYYVHFHDNKVHFTLITMHILWQQYMQYRYLHDNNVQLWSLTTIYSHIPICIYTRAYIYTSVSNNRYNDMTYFHCKDWHCVFSITIH